MLELILAAGARFRLPVGLRLRGRLCFPISETGLLKVNDSIAGRAGGVLGWFDLFHVPSLLFVPRTGPAKGIEVWV